MDTEPLVTALSGAQTDVEALVATTRALIVQANEEAPVNPAVGTIDEAQAEVLANLELALRHLEDAASRLSEAGVAWGPVPASTATADAGTETEAAA